MPEKHETQAEKIFLRAREMDDPDKLDVFLDGACSENETLRAAVEALLHADQQAANFFDPRVNEEESITAVNELTEGPGTTIDRYKLLEQIGEGGMGVVYMTEQTKPFIKKVALKIIKLGMDTKQVVARFEAERQALALMDHPNIAKVIDGGATKEGRPYFVMELVRGIPITEYCDKQKLSTRERLELFIPVCQAVQHAHQKGIIHRDLKPSNVLVTLNDGVPHPMVIDFGIAKATNQKLTEKTLFTNFSQMIGTPAYMSPEQAEMSRLDVDTRSDVYSLGVMLYELLIGVTPFPEKTLRSVNWGELQRILAEDEPEKPSARLSTLTDQERTSFSKRHSEDAGRIRLLVRRELDWIVMKCLEKDRNRRYATANGLAADIRRYLDGGAPEAAPPTLSYQLGKMARRHRRTVVTSLVAGVVLLVASIIATSLAVKATRAERLASLERDKSKEIGDYYRQLLIEGTDPWSPNTDPTMDLSLSEVITRASRGLDDRFSAQPDVEASIRLSLGRALQAHGLSSEAVVDLERALALCRSEYGDNDETTLETQIQLGFVLMHDKAESERAESLLVSAYQTLYERFGLNSELTLRALAYLTLHYMDRSQMGLANALDLPGVIERAVQIHDQDSPALRELKQSLAELRGRQARHADARDIYEELLAQERRERTQRGTGAPAHIREANLLRRVAHYESSWEGNHESASESLEGAYQISLQQVGDGFPTLTILEELSEVSLLNRDYDGVSKWSYLAFEQARRRWGPNDDGKLVGRVNQTAELWSFVPMVLGDWEEALRRLMEVRRHGVPSMRLLCRERLVRSLLQRSDEVEEIYRELPDHFNPASNWDWIFEPALMMAALPSPPAYENKVRELLSEFPGRYQKGYRRVNAYLLNGLLHYRSGDLNESIIAFKVVQNNVDNPVLTCIARYFTAMAEYRLDDESAALKTWSEAEKLIEKLLRPGRTANPSYRIARNELLALCLAVRLEAVGVIGSHDRPELQAADMEKRRIEWKPLAALIDQYDAQRKRGEFDVAYKTLCDVLGHPLYSLPSAQMYNETGGRSFASQALVTLAKADDPERFSRFATDSLSTLDPRLNEFNSSWARYLDLMPAEIYSRITNATPYWGRESGANRFGRYDLAWALYAQGKIEEAYEVVNEIQLNDDLWFSCAVRLLAARIAISSGRYSEAKEYFAELDKVIETFRPSASQVSPPALNSKEVDRELQELKELAREH